MQQRLDRAQQHVVAGAPAGRSMGIFVDQHGAAAGRGLRGRVAALTLSGQLRL